MYTVARVRPHLKTHVYSVQLHVFNMGITPNDYSDVIKLRCTIIKKSLIGVRVTEYFIISPIRNSFLLIPTLILIDFFLIGENNNIIMLCN